MIDKDNNPAAPAVGAPVADMVPRSRLVAMERELQEAADKLKAVQQSAGDEIRRLNREAAPRFESVWCSQCGRQFGPGNSGFSHCADHAAPAASAEGVTDKKAALEALMANHGNAEDLYIEQGRNMNCPHCGGSGHVDDVAPAASLREQEECFVRGWIAAAKWTDALDIISDIGSPAFETVMKEAVDAQRLGREKDKP
jgi:hypothetical protein